ncbi:hypothetical protein WICPIJ_003450 [Wickerhamomyces pijperi]|uniref:Probable transporter MCH1 n=1 Tax=Wickerhamomyces pijperi TaxID=599730 RepID=A0A9P8Q7N1_WICPI|nr:hypothetical protein WICPIJ_003450 [Wickerhamomyces pijperi]
MTVSSLEHILTKDIRAHLNRYPRSVLKQVAFLVSLISCLCAGSVLLFPLFTPVLSQYLTQVQINVIGSGVSLGLYLPLPILGYLADTHGPVILAIIGLISFSPSYYICSLYIQHQSLEPSQQWDYLVLAGGFAMIGMATSAMYFTSLLTCAKLYPEYKGLTISVPVTCYGLSSLIGSQILKMDFLQDLQKGQLDLFKTFQFFSYLYLILGLFNWVSSTVVTIERDVLLRSDEELPLLDNELTVKHHDNYIKFLKDFSAYILLFVVLLTIGPMEMYITNMGSIVTKFNDGSSISNQVSLYSIFSTLARLTMGGLSDFLLARFDFSRIYLLFIVIMIGCVAQLLLFAESFISTHFYIVSILSGFTYGALFTLLPTIVLSIWGSEMFGSTWGSFMIAPAIGGSGFNMLFAEVFQSRCTKIASTGGCMDILFQVITGSYALSAVLILVLGRYIWVRKQIKL